MSNCRWHVQFVVMYLWLLEKIRVIVIQQLVLIHLVVPGEDQKKNIVQCNIKIDSKAQFCRRVWCFYILFLNLRAHSHRMKAKTTTTKDNFDLRLRFRLDVNRS